MKVQNCGQPDDSQPSAAAGEAESCALPALPLDTALFLDVDGTLLDFAGKPDEVSTPGGLVTILGRLEKKLSGAVALVSGRPISQLDRLFSPLRLRASGVHGAEMRLDPASATLPAPRAQELPDALVASVADALRSWPGIFVEQKSYSVAVHYRGAPGAGPELRTILHRLIENTPDFRLEMFDAHFAFELKMPGFDKGRAVAMFLESEPFVGRIPIFIGDDKTDEAGFAAVTARGGRAYSVGVWRPGASGVFQDPRSVRAWLTTFAQ